jgi:hypothetical protein
MSLKLKEMTSTSRERYINRRIRSAESVIVVDNEVDVKTPKDAALGSGFRRFYFS